MAATVKPAEDKSKTLGDSKLDDIGEKVTKKLSRVGTFRILNRTQMSVILKELALDLKGITKGGEQRLKEQREDRRAGRAVASGCRRSL